MLKQAIKYIQKRHKSRHHYHRNLESKTAGYTMVELAVGMIVAFLIITPLLSFVVNMLNTDVKEQAKTNSEQELQAALTFIANDLKKSVYIYDKDGIEEIEDQLPHNGDTDKVPVLVFWKQDIIERVLPINTKNADLDDEHCTKKDADDNFVNPCDNAAVYSLVAYYFMTDESEVWDGKARIGRFEIRDEVGNPADYFEPVNGDKVSKAKKDEGFKLFDISSNVEGTFEQKMEAWTKAPEDYKETVNVLIDYVSKKGEALVRDCKKQLGQDENGSADIVGNDATGFYACVDSTKNVAKVFITADSYKRMGKDEDYKPKSSFFPQMSVTVQGRGSLGQ